MVQRDHRLYAVFQELVHKIAVVVERRLIKLAGLRLDLAPFHRETVGVERDILHELDIFLIPVPLIAGCPGLLPVINLGFALGVDGGLELVPVGVEAVAFHLVGSSGANPTGSFFRISRVWP